MPAGRLRSPAELWNRRGVAVLGGRAAGPAEMSSWLRRLGWAAAAVQAALLLAWSGHLYSRFDLSTDFGIFYQAWHQIAHGDLNPYSTLNPHGYPHYGYEFWRNHFELVMWPMALLWFVYPHAIDLLWVQDLATACATVVAFSWTLEILGANWKAARWAATAIALGTLAVILLNPWVWWSASFDFHLQALATLFALLAARDLWSARRRMWIWVALLLLCGNVSASYLIGVGMAGVLLSPRTRRAGGALIAIGVGWILLVDLIGGAEGTLLSNYGYLANARPGQAVGLGAIAWGGVTHLGRALSMLRSRLHVAYDLLAASGLVGVLAPVAIGVTAVVLLPNELNASPVFASADSAFQSLPLYYFVSVGTVAGFSWLARRHWRWPGLAGHRRWAALLVGALGMVLLGQALALSAIWLPRARTAFTHVDAAASAQLAQLDARIPARAEVIASQGIVGRLSGRRLVYPFLDVYADGQTVPLFGERVVFVLAPSQGIEYASPAATRAAVDFVRHRLHARQLAASAGIYAFSWEPPRGASSVTLPRAG